MEVLGSGSEIVLIGGVMGVGYRNWGFGECMRVGGLGLVGGSDVDWSDMSCSGVDCSGGGPNDGGEMMWTEMNAHDGVEDWVADISNNREWRERENGLG